VVVCENWKPQTGIRNYGFDVILATNSKLRWQEETTKMPKGSVCALDPIGSVSKYAGEEPAEALRRKDLGGTR
jgi:hypothetical protein